MDRPTEASARRIVERTLGIGTVSARRFLTGYCHYVYEVKLADGRAVVARIATPETRRALAGGVYWQRKLAPFGIPLPRLLHAQTEGEEHFMLLERLPGRDLGLVYPELTEPQKRSLAAVIADAQQRCAQLPPASGFGYALSYDDPALTKFLTWQQVLVDDLERSRRRILDVGVVDPEAVDRVARCLQQFAGYFSAVTPTAFLDDTTTRNVLVHEGALSGVVDVDSVCFGDPLFTIALTRMALLVLRFDTHYIDYWLDAVEATPEQHAVMELYTAIYAVNFLGEQGQRFNRDQGVINHDDIAFLEQTIDELLARIAG